MKKWLGMICIGILMTTTTACGSGGSKELASKEKPVIKEGKTIVTLSIQQPSEFMQIAEKKFEGKYPDIDLQIQNTEDYEKYTTTTNTALLSGKGPDIFEINGRMPIDDYVSKQLLLNMNDLLDQDKTLDKNDLQMDVLEVLKLNGGLYRVPSGFGMSVFVGDGNVIKNSTVKIDDKSWNWNTFEEISKQLIQQAEKGGKKHFYALADYPADSFLRGMVMDNYGEFVDRTAKKAKFNSPEFVELMQNIKKMFDEKVMTEQLGKMDNQLFSHASLMSPIDFIDGLYSYFENPVLLQKPYTEQSEGTQIFPLSEIAIRANSPVKDEAWKFISFLLSDEAQSLQEREGFSLLASVDDKKLNEIQEQVKSGTYKSRDGKKAKVSDEQFTQFKHLVHSAYRYVDADVKVLSIISEESEFFFSGQKSAEEVAKLIQNKVTIYLNE